MMDAFGETRRIIELLRYRHAPPEWASFSELSTSTGAQMARRLDFFAMSCWPSSGQHAIAYEVKVSRRDFAREIEDPSKRRHAEDVASECYFVTPHGLLKPDELPEGWGLIEAGAELRRVKVAAQRRVEA